MTRLQNAQKQLTEALAALESAATQMSEGFNRTDLSAHWQKKDFEAVRDEGLLALVDEINKIETKLNEAINLIAMIGSGCDKTTVITDGDK